MSESSNRVPNFCSDCPQGLYGRLYGVIGPDQLPRKAVQDSHDAIMATYVATCSEPYEGPLSTVTDDQAKKTRTRYCVAAMAAALDHPMANIVLQTDEHYA
ncbi:hypothetical protein H7171_02735 [Candidatus Saccharibacteria bacterium]|nr:hypothetical protein [Candidatus Saccharibacteria bacterium]